MYPLSVKGVSKILLNNCHSDQPQQGQIRIPRIITSIKLAQYVGTITCAVQGVIGFAFHMVEKLA